MLTCAGIPSRHPLGISTPFLSSSPSVLSFNVNTTTQFLSTSHSNSKIPNHVFNFINSINAHPKTLITTITNPMTMSLTSQNLLTNSPSRLSFYSPKFKNTNPTNLSFSFTKPLHFPPFKTQSPIQRTFTLKSSSSPLGSSFESDDLAENKTRVNRFDLDSFLSLAEFICLASSVVVGIGFVVNSAFNRPVFVWLGNGVLVWHLAPIIGGVVAGAVIRWRQWRRICKGFSRPGSSGVNLVARIEKLEEDLRSSATIIRVLSRQLEKLGIRFRATRKALKEPIGETAALVQKNSEATHALAAQEDHLEKELGEIQKVLLAMQEQQQKQLDLILAIGKNGNLWEDRRGDPSNSPVDKVKQKAPKQVQTLAVKEEGNTDFGLGI